MKSKPMRRYGHPKFPTKLEVNATPDLLLKHRPSGWRPGTEAAAALGILLAATGCSQLPDGGAAARAAKAKAAIVAPVFRHGTGIGATGCIVTAPPTYLSESEAISIIQDVLKPHGIQLTEHATAVPDAVIRHDKSYQYTQNTIIEHPASYRPLISDARDPARNITIEFVDMADCKEFGQEDSSSTVQDYNYAHAAQTLQKRLAANATNGAYGVFYAPAEKNATESAKLLRAQAKDFVEWLKGQGVI